MLGRCNNLKDQHYSTYGGRGIKVCKRWSGNDGFINFVEDMGEKPKGKSIDRIDNDGGYTPENCRWATHKEQMCNTSSNLSITILGKEYKLTDIYGNLTLKPATVRARLYKGWPTACALFIPSLKHETLQMREHVSKAVSKIAALNKLKF